MQDAPSLSSAARTLKTLLGRNLTAFIACVRDPSIVDLWTAGFPDPAVEKRLFLAHRVASMLCAMDQCDDMRSWFLRPQYRLGNRSPAQVIRDSGDRDDVVTLLALSAMGAKYECS